MFAQNAITLESLHSMPLRPRAYLMLGQLLGAVVLFVVSSPLNLIPGGTILFVLLNAVGKAWATHAVYLTHRGLGLEQQCKWVFYEHLLEYVAFGIPSVLLALIPLLSLFFYFTTITGATLWSIELERTQALSAFAPLNPSAKQSVASATVDDA